MKIVEIEHKQNSRPASATPDENFQLCEIGIARPMAQLVDTQFASASSSKIQPQQQNAKAAITSASAPPVQEEEYSVSAKVIGEGGESNDGTSKQYLVEVCFFLKIICAEI